MSYRFHSNIPYSANSLRITAQAESYEIHLVKSDDPDYIPADQEVWPIYQSAIVAALRNFPEAHQAALAAFKQKQQEIKGRENRTSPRGKGPL
jgi:hypothetical protein